MEQGLIDAHFQNGARVPVRSNRHDPGRQRGRYGWFILMDDEQRLPDAELVVGFETTRRHRQTV
jgi:hypothetical protein